MFRINDDGEEEKLKWLKFHSHSNTVWFCFSQFLQYGYFVLYTYINRASDAIKVIKPIFNVFLLTDDQPMNEDALKYVSRGERETRDLEQTVAV